VSIYAQQPPALPQTSNKEIFHIVFHYRSTTSHSFRYRQAPILEQMAETQNIVGPVIRQLREKKGLTQAQLVAKLNLIGWDLSRGTLAKIEAQLRCVTDYEIPVLAISVGLEPEELLRRAITRIPKRPRS
jgi:ribosome-binding protein aMBF1 (putative translation factor)